MCAAFHGWRHLVKATEVTVGRAESTGSLLPGIWRDSLHVACGLTALHRGSAPGPTLDNEYGRTFTFTCVTEFLERLVFEMTRYESSGTLNSSTITT